MQKIVTHSEAETETVAAHFAREAKDGDFFALFGEMGCGKTVFARGFVGAIIPEARVASPTYAILYDYIGNGRIIHHFDCYRVESEEDLISTGYEEVTATGITLCEWPEKILDFLPNTFWKLTFSKISETERMIEAERITR